MSRLSAYQPGDSWQPLKIPKQLQDWLSTDLLIPAEQYLDGRSAVIMINAQTKDGFVAQLQHIGGEWVDSDTDKFFYHTLRLVTGGFILTSANFAKKVLAGWGWQTWGKNTDLKPQFTKWWAQLHGLAPMVVGITTRSGKIEGSLNPDGPNESVLPKLNEQYFNNYPNHRFIVFTTRDGASNLQAEFGSLSNAQILTERIEIVVVDDGRAGLDQKGMLVFLRQVAQLEVVSCEGGPALWTSLAQENLIDLRFITTTPHVFGTGITVFQPDRDGRPLSFQEKELLRYQFANQNGMYTLRLLNMQ